MLSTMLQRHRNAQRAERALVTDPKFARERAEREAREFERERAERRRALRNGTSWR
jgi:hypothetical protein